MAVLAGLVKAAAVACEAVGFFFAAGAGAGLGVILVTAGLADAGRGSVAVLEISVAGLATFFVTVAGRLDGVG